MAQAYVDLSRYSEAVMRGDDDGGAAINSIISGAGDNKSDWQSFGTIAIYIPSYHRGAPTNVQVSTAITPDRQRNFRIYSDASWGGKLTNATGSPYLARCDLGSIGRVIEFQGLAIDDGSIEIVGPNRGPLIVRDCNFNRATAPAIHTPDEDESTFAGGGGSGVGVVGLIVERNYFQQCAGAIWATSSTHAVGKIRDNRMLNSDDIPLRINGPGWRIFNNDMQAISQARTLAGDSAFVWLEDNTNAGNSAGNQHATSGIWFYGNRFGSETDIDYFGTGYGVAQHAIMYGDPNNPSEQKVSGAVFLEMNEFLGQTNQLDGVAGEGEYAVSWFHRPNGCYIGPQQMIRNYKEAFIGEQWNTTGADSHSTGADRNFLNLHLRRTGNNAPAGYIPGTPKVFQHNGHNWRKPFLDYGQLRFTAPNTNEWVFSVNNSGVLSGSPAEPIA